MQEVACRASHLAVDYAVSGRNVVINPGVHKHQTETVLSAQEIDTGSSFGEMAELLPCHLFGRNADSFAYDSVVGGKQYIARIGESRGESLLYQSDLYGQMLQLAERALRLGKVVHFVAQRRLYRAVGTPEVECDHFIFTGIPDMVRYTSDAISARCRLTRP